MEPAPPGSQNLFIYQFVIDINQTHRPAHLVNNLFFNYDIPIGHKAALRDIKKGDTIIKYGFDIGKAVADIKLGEHAHVHNIKTKRW